MEDEECKRRIEFVDLGGGDYLTLTLPILKGAVFNGGLPLSSSSVSGVSYEILGHVQLEGIWSLQVVELLPALDSGLPALGDYDGTPGADWEYRTFRLVDAIGSTSRQFMKGGATASP